VHVSVTALLALLVVSANALSKHNTSHGARQRARGGPQLNSAAQRAHSGESSAASSSARIDRAVGRMHLQILRWYCEELREAHSTTLPCENYGRMVSALSAASKAERVQVDADKQASMPKDASEQTDRTRLVKASYTAMKTAFCNVPAHQLACINPDLGREYDDLSRAPSTPAEALDRKAYHVLTISRRRSPRSGITGESDAPHATKAGRSNDRSRDSYLKDSTYDPPEG